MNILRKTTSSALRMSTAEPVEALPVAQSSPATTALKPAKILLWYWGRTGAGPLYTLELLRTLRTQPGLTVTASLATGNSLREDFLAQETKLDWVETYHDKVSFALATLRLPMIRQRFQRYLRAERFDVVLSTMGHLWTPLLVDCISASGAAYIPVLHDATPHPGEAQPLWRWRRQRELQQARHVITLSAAVAGGVTAGFGYPTDNMSVIPYGVAPLPNMPPKSQPYPTSRPFRFLFFGRIMAYKGLDLLLEAWREVRQAQPQAELVIAGAGDLTPYAHQLVALTGVTCINRWIDDADIPNIFADADAVVLPYREASQSGVTNQAYAAGLPIVATPVGGLVEQIVPDKTGVLTASVSAPALAAAMRQVMDMPLYAHLAQGVHQHRETLTFAAQAPLYAAVLRNALLTVGRT